MCAIPLAAMGVASYAMFMQCEPKRRTEQRMWIHFLRTTLSQKFGLVNLQPCGKAWDSTEGDKMLECIWIFFLFVCCIGFVHEGYLVVAFVVAAVALIFTACFVVGSSRPLCRFVLRTMFATQAISLLLFEHESTPQMLRRTISLRATGTVIFVESLEESFIHMLATCMILDFRYRGSLDAEQRALILLPLKMFMLVVLPINLLGIKDMITSSLHGKRFSSLLTIKFVTGVRFSACLLPVQLVSSAFSLGPARYSALWIAVTYLCFGLVLRLVPRASKYIDMGIAPNATVLHKRLQAADCAWISVVKLGMLPSMFVMRVLNRPIAILFLVSVGILTILCEDKLYSEYQTSIFMLTGCALLLLQGYASWMISVMMFLGFVAWLLCTLTTCSKEVTFARIASENEAESFLSHAVKQKFASVGSAVEHILLNKSYNHPLLHMVMDECRLGHARCLASSVYRKLEQGEQRPASKRTYENLLVQLQSCSVASRLLVSVGTEFIDLDVVCEMDWEIAHLICLDLARRGRKLIKVWTTQNDVRMKLDLAVQRDNPVLDRLVQEIGGRFEGDVLIMPITRMAKASSPPIKPKFTLAKNSKHEELAKLKFALVDDNELIRKNFERLLCNNLGVQKENIFTFGQTLEECKQFPGEICALKVDVAIFDQNLDFDEGNVLKGSELAVMAKKEGFKGCLILHSSDVNLAELLEAGVFHGAVEKSADSVVFVNGILQAWHSFKG